MIIYEYHNYDNDDNDNNGDDIHNDAGFPA